MFSRVRKWAKHKLSHVSVRNLKQLFKAHGLAFVVIFIVWEIIEDALFPLLFYWMGNNIDPWFHAAIPVSWLLCLHGIMVPLTWSLWIKIRRKNVKENDDC